MKKAIKNLKNSFIDFMKACNTKLEQSGESIKDVGTTNELADQVINVNRFWLCCSLIC